MIQLKSLKLAIGSALLIALSTTAAFAVDENIGTGTVTTEVSAINALAVKGGTVALTVNAAVAGAAPTEVSNAITQTYDITTNEESRKITAKIDLAMPEGVTLAITLAAPEGATSIPDVALTATAQDAVTGISTLNETGKVITYKLSATSAAGVIASITKTVTLTITNGS